MQVAKGEAKEFVFSNIRQKDLIDPIVAIPMGVRWLMYKSKRAAAKLGKQPSHEDIILEYKGLGILKNGTQIYLAGIGDFGEPRKTGLHKHTFPRFGPIEDNGRSIQFIAIKNERNQCFGAFSGEEHPCPPEPFPTKN